MNSNKTLLIIETILVLQIVTMIIAYFETSFSKTGGDFLYYYKGIGNSLVYILTGNLTSVIFASIYSDKLLKMERESIVEITG